MCKRNYGKIELWTRKSPSLIPLTPSEREKNCVVLVCAYEDKANVYAVCFVRVPWKWDVSRAFTPCLSCASYIVEWFLAVCLVGRAWNKSLVVCVLAENNRNGKKIWLSFFLSIRFDKMKHPVKCSTKEEICLIFNARFTFRFIVGRLKKGWK